MSGEKHETIGLAKLTAWFEHDSRTAEEQIREGPLEPNKPVEEIRQDPIDLHKDFKWVTMNLAEEAEVS